jgi:hypothetical protein
LELGLPYILGKSGGATSDALSNYKGAFDNVKGYQKAIGEAFADDAKALVADNPGMVLKFTPAQAQDLSYLAEKFHFNLTDVPIEKAAIDGLNPVEVQKLSTQLNKYWTKPEVETFYQGLRDAASESFGPQFDSIYSNYTDQIRGVQSLHDIFNTSNKAPTASDISRAITTIQRLGSNEQSQAILQNVLDNFKQLSGIDLTNQVSAIQAVNKVNNPTLKKAAVKVAKIIGKVAIAGLGLRELGSLAH